MRDRLSRLAVIVAFGGLCAFAPSRAQEPPPAAAAAAAETRVLTFRAAAVDGVDELVVRGQDARIEHLEWRPIQGADVVLDAGVPPTAGLRCVVRAKAGRPAVRVLQGPSAQNDFELRVRIDDGPHPGASPLAFELWLVPAASLARRPDVVLVTIDSLRADRLGAYGHARPTSPNLDAFARIAVRHERAFSTSSFTPPSLASLLTSRHVGDHGLLTWEPLPEEQLSLAEVLSANGYRTGACVHPGLLSAQNLGQGFEWRREGNRDARAIVSDALEFLRADDERPFFLWLHLYDVHRPYGRAHGAADRFAREPRAGVGDVEAHYNLRPEDVRARGLDERDLEYLVDRYDAGIAYADAELGPLFSALSTPARAASTLVVVSADHGESLLEHEERRFSHDPFLHGVVTRIPLLLRYPGSTRPEVRTDLASGIDLAPTILDVVGAPLPPTFQGRSLRAAAAGAPERAVFHECWGWERLAAVRTADWLVIRDVAEGRDRAFDLRSDPRELAPIDPASVPAARELAARLLEFSSRPGGGGEPAPLDPDVLEELRRLGYVGDR